MPLELVELDDPRWLETLRAADEVDVFYRPEYARFRLEGLGHRAVLLRFEDPLGVVFDVTTLKDVSRLPFYAELEAKTARPPLDLASPEYNGPIAVAAEADRAPLLARYRRALDDYCREAGVVTEFVRFHPFSADAATVASLEPLASVSDVVYVETTAGYEAAAARYRPEHRTAIRKALRGGAEIRFVTQPDASAVERFAELYVETMDRKQDVKSYYRYTRAFFDALLKNLGASAVLVEAYAEGRIAAATISLLGPRRLWYMYGGSRLQGLASAANKLMFDRLVAWAAERGLAALVLCGGFTAGDGLYQFKHGYSRASAKVMQLRKVHDPEGLARLEAGKASWDRSRGQPTRLDYFPSYWLD